MINFDYDKVIIVKYFTGGGGTFLLACLGLSDDAVLKHEGLAQMQLDGKLPIEKKLKYLLLATKEQSEKQIWSDWGLYDFWGFKAAAKDTRNCKDYKEHISRRCKPIISKCMDNNKFILKGLHDDRTLIKMLKYWKNSKAIVFKNEENLASNRTLGADGRTGKPLELHLQHLRNRKAYCMTKSKLDQFQINNLSYEWDSDWYFSKDKTVSEIEKLYDSLGLSGFNAEMISEFYDAWTNAIKLQLR